MSYTPEELDVNFSRSALKALLCELGGTPGAKKKEDIINEIIAIERGELVPLRSGRGRPSKASALRGGRKGSIKLAVHDVESEFAYSDTVKGLLDLHQDGFGFIRVKNGSYSHFDAFVSKTTIKSGALRGGDFVVGKIAKKRENELAELTEIISVNGKSDYFPRKPLFDTMVLKRPEKRISLATKDDSESELRIIDLIAPIGYGQRGLIVAPPKTGTTTLIKNVALSIEKQHPKMRLIVLLIDERPEDLADFKSGLKTAEIFGSSFDETPEYHIRITELALSRAKRLAEDGEDVFLLLDSATKLVRAYNSSVQASGKILNGGIDPTSLSLTKRFFGAARNTDDGTLTIVATAFVDTGSQMDDFIYEAFKGVGNMELVLSARLSEKGVFPAIDIVSSGTRKDDLLLSSEELGCSKQIRNLVRNDDSAYSDFLSLLDRTKNNAELIKKLNEFLKRV